MKQIKNLVDGTIYAVGNNDEALIKSWNENAEKNLEWIIDTFDNQEAYDELTEEVYRIENIEDIIYKLNDFSENNKIEIVEEELLSYENLMNVNYDEGNQIYELEFQENGKSFFVNIKTSEHKEAEFNENYFDNKELVEKIIANADKIEIK